MPYRRTILSIAMATLLAPVWVCAATAEDLPPAAEDPVGASAFITQLSDEVMTVLNDTTVTQDERDEIFREKLRAGFDLNYVAKLLLGRHNRTATKPQLDEYLTVFPEYILRVYVSRLTEFGDEIFEVTGTQPAGKRDLFVRSLITSGDGPPFELDWRVRRYPDGEFYIVDLKVEGISMAVTKREEFSGRIAEIGMDGLIGELRADSGETKQPNER